MGNRDASIEDLYWVDGKAEIVCGKLVLMPAAGGLHAFASLAIASSLREHARRTKTGYGFGDNVGFVVNLPNRRSFSPDAAFWAGMRLTRKFIDGPPTFAAEVRSDQDYGPVAEREMAQKRADYFAAGTLVVWDVDVLEEQCIRSYVASDPAAPIIFKRGESASAEPAVRGWSMRVDDLFPSE
jgi:Uma2 family endonuclease